MSIKREGLDPTIIKEYLSKKPYKKVSIRAPKKVEFKKDNIKCKDEVFLVQKTVVDMLESLYNGESKVVSNICGNRIVGYKIGTQNLIRVDIYKRS